VLAGGVEKVAARPEWLLRAAVLFSVGGAPVEFCRGSAGLVVLAARWRGGARPSLAGVRETADPGVEVLQGVGDVDHDVGVDGARWRLFGVRGSTTSRLQRATSVPRSKGGAAAARHRHGLLVVDEDEIQMDFFVILLFLLGLSVRIVV
jgi:hypothetical protein